MEHSEWRLYEKRVQHLSKEQARALVQECHVLFATYTAATSRWLRTPFLADLSGMMYAAYRRANRLERDEQRAYFAQVRERIADDAKFAEWEEHRAWREVPWNQARLDQVAQVTVRMPKDRYEFSMWYDRDTWFCDRSENVCARCGRMESEAGTLMTHSRTLETRCLDCWGVTIQEGIA